MVNEGGRIEGSQASARAHVVYIDFVIEVCAFVDDSLVLLTGVATESNTCPVGRNCQCQDFSVVAWPRRGCNRSQQVSRRECPDSDGLILGCGDQDSIRAVHRNTSNGRRVKVRLGCVARTAEIDKSGRRSANARAVHSDAADGPIKVARWLEVVVIILHASGLLRFEHVDPLRNRSEHYTRRRSSDRNDVPHVQAKPSQGNFAPGTLLRGKPAKPGHPIPKLRRRYSAHVYKKPSRRLHGTASPRTK